MKKINGLKKGLVYALTTAMVASCAVGIGPLEARAAMTGTVNADALNVRSGASTGYSRVGTVTQGQTVSIMNTVQGEDGYTWYQISGAASGYVRSDFVSNVVSDTPVRSTSSSGTITADWLNVRSGAGTNFSRLGSIAGGTRLTVISVHGEWYKITASFEGEIRTGYVHSQYVQMDGESGGNQNPDDGNQNPDGGDSGATVIAAGVVNVDALNVRSGASTSDSVLGTIHHNDNVEILGQTGSWYKVRCSVNGSMQTGYVYAEYITKTSDANNGGNGGGGNGESLGKGVVNADVLNVRSGAGSNHSVIGLLYQNASVRVIGQEGEWYKVSCVVNGATREGYVFADFITISDNNGGGNEGGNEGGNQGGNGGDSQNPVGKSGIVTADALNFRTGPGTEHSTLGLAYLGTQVNILGEEGSWYKVSCVMNGVLKEGYMSKEFVKIAGADDEPYDGEPDADFETQISEFPESYKNALRRLHDKHPQWQFEAKYTGLDFNYSVDSENSGNRSMIYVSSTTPFSWLSTAPGDYDWATDTYVNKDGAAWKGAARELIAYYMDPRNFLDEQQIFMFESQSNEATHSRDVTAGILNNTFMSDGNGYHYNGRYYTYVDTFMEAGQISGASPYFLASRCRQEVGGGSAAADGSYGYYNFFNIGAYASGSGNAVTNGINYASQTGKWRRPWTSPWLSIVGGAEFLAQSYINDGQNTDYFQKFNVVSRPYYDHQYMGNIQAPASEGSSRYSTYKELGVLDSKMTFIIPVYDNMPETAAAMPPAAGNPNAYIKYLSINGGGVGLNQTFTYNTQKYTAVTREASINISATPVSDYASIVSGAGYHELRSGENIIEVVCQAGNGDQETYTFRIYRQ